MNGWLASVVVAIAVAGCAVCDRDAAGAERPHAKRWIADRLVFGRSIPGGGSVSDAAWERFLREVVSPSFPAGLTIWRAEGEWTGSQGPVREPVMVIEVVHPAGRPGEAVFDRIATEYAQRFRQDAVLRLSAPVTVRFYEYAR